MSRRHVPSGLSRADALTILASSLACVVLLLAVRPFHRIARRKAGHVRCRKNLAAIGKSMLIYAGDYDEVLPVAGGRGTVWGPGLHDWKAESRDDAFGLDPNGAGGQATISSSLYLLVRYTEILPERFVCEMDKRTSGFWPKKYGITAEELTGIWDFGPDPARHCSYAYHIPYGKYALTTSSEPGLVVAADRNPWIDGPRQQAGDFSMFIPDTRLHNGTSKTALRGNARAHNNYEGYNGQFVLYLDGHVEFAMRAFCGLEDDNVYTSWGGKDKVRGVPPKPYESQPAGAKDSLLVNDPPLGG
jgi:hypothetical protein